MLRVGTAAFVLCAATTAHADRKPVIDAQLGAGTVTDEQDYYYEAPETVTMFRARLGIEEPILPYPVEPGYAWKGSLVPELQLGMIDHKETGEAFVTVGARAELLFAQEKQGLAKVSARGGMWLAGRLGVVGEHRDTIWEGAMGWYLWLWSTGFRIGWEIGVLGIEGQATDEAVPGTIRFDTGYDDEATAFQMSMFLGKRL